MSTESYMGISRGPDIRPPEVKAAQERIGFGYPAYGPASHQICMECRQTAHLLFEEIKHLDGCETGRVLAEWFSAHPTNIG